MSDIDGVKVGITCDKCSHEFQIGIAGVDLETFRYDCPSCGFNMGFSKDDIEQIMAAHSAAADEAGKMFDKAIEDIFKKYQ